MSFNNYETTSNNIEVDSNNFFLNLNNSPWTHTPSKEDLEQVVADWLRQRTSR